MSEIMKQYKSIMKHMRVGTKPPRSSAKKRKFDSQGKNIEEYKKNMEARGRRRS